MKTLLHYYNMFLLPCMFTNGNIHMEPCPYTISSSNTTGQSSLHTIEQTASLLTTSHQAKLYDKLEKLYGSLQLAHTHNLHKWEIELLYLLSKEYRKSGMTYLGEKKLYLAMKMAAQFLDKEELSYFKRNASQEIRHYFSNIKDVRGISHYLRNGNKTYEQVSEQDKNNQLTFSNTGMSSYPLTMSDPDPAVYYVNRFSLPSNNMKISLDFNNTAFTRKLSFVKTENSTHSKPCNECLSAASDTTTPPYDNALIFILFPASSLVYMGFMTLKGKYNNRKQKKPVHPAASNQFIAIAHSTEQNIMTKIKEFEQETGYTDQSVSLTFLASQFDTNTKYLSTIIRKHYNKNFNAYINELRIEYILALLDTDITYKKYKISYLAELSGFSSHSKFASVFKKLKGCSPSEFIHNVQSNTSPSKIPDGYVHSFQ